MVVGLVVGLVGRIVARRRKSNFDYFGAGSRQLRKGLRRPRKRVIGDFHGGAEITKVLTNQQLYFLSSLVMI